MHRQQLAVVVAVHNIEAAEQPELVVVRGYYRLVEVVHMRPEASLAAAALCHCPEGPAVDTDYSVASLLVPTLLMERNDDFVGFGQLIFFSLPGDGGDV